MQVAVDHGLHIGDSNVVDARSNSAELARHLMAAGHQHAGQRLADHRGPAASS